MYPEAMDPEAVGSYPASVGAGGGYVWDEVLEYRVWCSPHAGAEDLENGSDYYYPFASYVDASEFARRTPGADEPLALILQREHVNEPRPGTYEHVRDTRRTERTIPDFFAAGASPDRLDILRGEKT